MFQVREWTLIILDTRAKGILKSSWKSLGKGACIKYAGAGGGGWRVLQIFQKKIRSPGDHTPKYFTAK